MNTDVHTLSGGYAMDALSREEAAEFTSHLADCEACRIEVRELQAVAATLGASEATRPPAHLKARILAAADQSPQLPPKVMPMRRVRSTRWTTWMVSAAAAIVLIVGAGIGIGQLRGSSDNQPAEAAAVTQVFRAKDARTATVDTSNGGKVTVAASRQLRRMALETRALPTLGSRQVYQLWAIHDGSPTSAGLVDDVAAGKAMALPTGQTTVAITIEPVGGSKRPTTKPIVTMDPRAV